MTPRGGGETTDAAAALRWLVAMGADEAVEDAPRDRLSAPPPPRPAAPPAPRPAAPARSPPPPPPPSLSIASTDQLVEEARAAAAAAADIPALAEAVAAFDGCALKRTAKSTVFADGNAEADLMLVGEAPGAEEDRRGLPFVGPAGRLLDLMLAAIGRDRDSARIANVLFWRPPGNRAPSAEEIALCRPFVDRHIALVRPRVLVCVGGVAAKSLLGRTEGIGRLRGRWHKFAPDGDSEEIAAAALFHPAYLLRQPGHKRQAWQDLLRVRDRLEGERPDS